ncbi:uncharacterized protein LOC124273324 [Haliotis rubra]|uniref:uncharacterized protein LOC124273324 n=1 Tax=Haliotis rubra TaxID=36100 RepID=UPI001EE5742D|nr:uncharacterized protein LOC124273324 [Haliotis rubra]
MKEEELELRTQLEISEARSKFTEGEAHQVVKGFGYLDASSGYKAAMAELEVRYGNQETIANALIKRAMCWPNIKADNAKALDEYAVFLNECHNAVTSLHSVKVLEYPDNIRKLVMKLPFHCQEKWRGIVLQIRLSGSTIEFSNLVQFVRREAQKAMDPMYGKEAMRPDDKTQAYRRVLAKPSTGKVQSKQTFGTDLINASKMEKDYSIQQPSRFDANDQKPCDYCANGGHFIDSCKRLASKPHIDRLNFLKSKGLCFRCFEQGHRSKECQKNVICQHCKGNHSTLLHIDSKTNLKCLSACTGQADEDMETGDSKGDCTLAVIPVKVTFKDTLKVISTYAFLDPGSTISFCSESLMNQLGCNGKSKKVEITIDTLGEPHTSFVRAVSGLKVHDMDLKNTVVLPTVYSRSNIPVSNRHIPTDADVAQWPHFDGIHVPHLESGVDLLIGGNAPDAYSPFEVKVGPEGSPHATRTRLGWILWNVVRPSRQGEKQHFPSMRTDIVSVRNIEEISELNSLVRKSINFDFPERSIDDKAEMSQEDKRFLDKVSESVSLQEGEYYINLPFKCSNVQMPNNSVQALKRLDSLKRRFLTDSKFHDDYETFMENILVKGYAEKVPTDELEGQPGKIWYIPHHGIYHPRKADKIRVVFDCSASFQGVSLNNMLIQGPNMTNSLIGILLRFRQDQVAFMGDIESMFYRVKVPNEDRNYLRFYWWPRGDCDEKPEIYRMCVHLFGAISSSSCATFALQQTAEDNKERYVPEVVNMVENNFYVDDCLASVEDEERAVYLINELSKLCKDGGFRLTKWVCNSKSVMKTIPTEERAKEVKELNLECESLPSERALGVFANRLTTIHEGSEVEQWKYVNTKLNPADVASRGMMFDKFKLAQQWFKGPGFLWRPRVEWPLSPDICVSVPDEDPEVKNSGQHFRKEVEVLKGNKNQVNNGRRVSKSSPLYKLDPFIENGIIRVGGRLQRAKIQHDSKHPVVLPKTSPLSKLMIKDAHTAVGHMGRNAILAHLRQRFWILGAGVIIKSLVSKCVICKKYQSPTGQQQMADLPDDRLQPDKPPFSHVGMDFFGPFLVKRGRATMKRYGVIFSCLTMRAVHLELACSLDTDSCINAIRRFISRRGQPEVIRSDNGTNLTSSERELKEEILKLNQPKLHSSLLERGIDWHFNPPAASHHGGSWERMIRSIRKVLHAVVHEQTIKLDDEGLSTLFVRLKLFSMGDLSLMYHIILMI